MATGSACLVGLGLQLAGRLNHRRHVRAATADAAQAAGQKSSCYKRVKTVVIRKGGLDNRDPVGVCTQATCVSTVH